jgi:hypothetical protein
MPITALTQDVVPERGGRINTLFRAVDIGAHIAVPLFVTTFTSSRKEGGTSEDSSSFLMVSLSIAALQVVGAMSVASLSRKGPPKSINLHSISTAISNTSSIYADAMHIKDLLGFVLAINVLPLIDSVARAFFAYRLVELGESDALFGVGTSLASSFAFIVMISLGG